MTEQGLGGMVDELQRRASRGVRELRAYLASPEGQQLRRRVAQALIITAPLLFRLGPFKASRVGRILGIAGGAAIVVKLAEALRDWEPLEEARDALTDGD